MAEGVTRCTKSNRFCRGSCFAKQLRHSKRDNGGGPTSLNKHGPASQEISLALGGTCAGEEGNHCDFMISCQCRRERYPTSASLPLVGLQLKADNKIRTESHSRIEFFCNGNKIVDHQIFTSKGSECITIACPLGIQPAWGQPESSLFQALVGLMIYDEFPYIGSFLARYRQVVFHFLIVSLLAMGVILPSDTISNQS